jgi:hypothetical protein
MHTRVSCVTLPRAAQVGDFGLSIKMDRHETHISHVFQGTMSHMAPGAGGGGGGGGGAQWRVAAAGKATA